METSPRKVVRALWICGLALAAIVVFVNILGQFFNPDFKKK